jgi:hypothetical protein
VAVSNVKGGSGGRATDMLGVTFGRMRYVQVAAAVGLPLMLLTHDFCTKKLALARSS